MIATIEAYGNDPDQSNIYLLFIQNISPILIG